MIQTLLNHLARCESGLFIHAPAGTCQRLAEAVGEAGKTLAGLTETEDSVLAIEQLADQLAVDPGHTIAATLEAASHLIGEPIYVLIDRAERLEHADLAYALKSARDALASSELAGLRLAFFSTERAALERMTRLQASAFFCAPILDVADEIAWEQAPAVGREYGAVEHKLECAIREGFRQTVERNKARLAELGVDDADLTEFVRLQVEIGHWPEGDLLQAFRAWRDQKNTSNADPGRRP